MKALFRYFKVAPAVPEIQNSEEVGQLYKYWRYRILSSMFVGYAFYYFTRKSFVIAMPGLIENLHFEKTELGFLGTIFSVTYGISKFTSGFLSDRSSPRYFMAMGLFLTGLMNIFFGMSSSILTFAIFWGCNGWFQGFGAPPCVRLLTSWYSHSERGSWWSTWSVSHNVGAFLIPWIAGPCLHYFGWRYALYVPGVFCMILSLYLFKGLRDTPQSLGLPPIEDYRQDSGENTVANERADAKMSQFRVLWLYVLKNPYVWLLAVSYFFVYVVRTGISDWTTIFLLETKRYSVIGATGFVSLFELGGFCGSLVAGWSSDRFFRARRGPVNSLFAGGMILTVLAFWYAPSGHQWLDSALMFLIGFTIFGPQMLIGVAAAELTHKSAAATSNGFVGCAGYMGAACAGAPLGMIIQNLGWEAFFFALVICSGLSLLALLPMWNTSQNCRLAAVTA